MPINHAGMTASYPQVPGSAGLFGLRLQRLVETVHPEGRQPYTDTEIAAQVGVTAAYIRKLRAGKSMPSLEKGRAIAAFFDVDVDYFLQPDEHPAVVRGERQLQLVADARAGRTPAVSPEVVAELDEEEIWSRLRSVRGVKEIALRAGQLPPDARNAVLEIVNHILRSEPGKADASAHDPREL